MLADAMDKHTTQHEDILKQCQCVNYTLIIPKTNLSVPSKYVYWSTRIFRYICYYLEAVGTKTTTGRQIFQT